MKTRFLAALAVSFSMLVACGDDNSSSANGDDEKELSSSSTQKSSDSKDKSSSSKAKSSSSKDKSSSSKKEDKSEYKREFATSIASGETMFIGTMSLDHTGDLGKDYIEVGTRAGVVYYDNSLFIADLDVGTIARYSLLYNFRRVFLVRHSSTVARHKYRPADMPEHQGTFHVLRKEHAFHRKCIRVVMVQALFELRHDMHKPIFEIFSGVRMERAIFQHLNLVASLFQERISGRNRARVNTKNNHD